MAFNRNKLSSISSSGGNNVYAYVTQDTILQVVESGYFNNTGDIMPVGTMIICSASNASGVLTIREITPEGVTNISSRNRPVFEGTISSNSSITKIEIEAALTAAGIVLPLPISTTLYVHDPAANPDRTFLCKYYETTDQWYFEKLSLAV